MNGQTVSDDGRCKYRLGAFWDQYAFRVSNLGDFVSTKRSVGGRVFNLGDFVYEKLVDVN